MTLPSVWSKLKSELCENTRKYEHYIVRMAKWMSEVPAKILKIFHVRGAICKGKLADFIIWDPEQKLSKEESFSKFKENDIFLDRAHR